MEGKNIKYGWAKEDSEDEDDDEDEDEDDDPQQFREKIDEKATPAMLKLISGDGSPEVVNALDEANYEIMKWRGDHKDIGEMINPIDYLALAGIIKEGLTFLNMLVANPLDENATNSFKQADAKFRTAVAQNSYLDT